MYTHIHFINIPIFLKMTQADQILLTVYYVKISFL